MVKKLKTHPKMLFNQVKKVIYKVSLFKALLMLLLGLNLQLGSLQAQVQGLQLNYFNIPDTIYFQSLVPVDFSITNTTDSNLLGNLKINFLNETFNNVEAPLGGFEAVQFFAPQQDRSFTTFIPVEPQYFIEGGNTVVIWPSFVGQPIPAVDSIRVNIFVGEVNGVSGNPPSLLNFYYIQNPVLNKIFFKPKQGTAIPAFVSIFDASGRVLIQAAPNADGSIDVSQLPDGILFIQAQLENDITGYFKLIKASQ